jgi:ABC-type Fe3+/spermidine/putrescine transport system ATPase subunit
VRNKEAVVANATERTAEPLLSLRGVRKRFGEVNAVDDISLDVMSGEFVSLLGPSGCGKTTTLRVIAGFERPTSGEIRLQGRNIVDDPPNRRNTAMVFQSYALFPHMTVEQNTAFGLRMRRVEKEVATEKVRDALTLTNLTGLEKRYPRELSGGQQQRVALARALAVRPVLLLLDEPLSNLDAKLRERMRIDLKMIQREVGITTLFVTHDQEEALTMSDRIVVMLNGKISEIGTPWDVYHQPSSTFAATFIGHVNTLEGTVVGVSGTRVSVRTAGGLLVEGRTTESLTSGDTVLVTVKEEQVQIESYDDDTPAGPDLNELAAELKLIIFLGGSIQYVCEVAGNTINARRSNEGTLPFLAAGTRVRVTWRIDESVVINNR